MSLVESSPNPKKQYGVPNPVGESCNYSGGKRFWIFIVNYKNERDNSKTVSPEKKGDYVGEEDKYIYRKDK